MVMISGNRIVRESDGDDVDIGHIPIAIADRLPQRELGEHEVAALLEIRLDQTDCRVHISSQGYTFAR